MIKLESQKLQELAANKGWLNVPAEPVKSELNEPAEPAKSELNQPINKLVANNDYRNILMNKLVSQRLEELAVNNNMYTNKPLVKEPAANNEKKRKKLLKRLATINDHRNALLNKLESLRLEEPAANNKKSRKKLLKELAANNKKNTNKPFNKLAAIVAANSDFRFIKFKLESQWLKELVDNNYWLNKSAELAKSELNEPAEQSVTELTRILVNDKMALLELPSKTKKKADTKKKAKKVKKTPEERARLARITFPSFGFE